MCSDMYGPSIHHWHEADVQVCRVMLSQPTPQVVHLIEIRRRGCVARWVIVAS